MAYFPLYIELENRTCFVVGGGRVAAGKVGQLLAFGARVTVIAPQLAPELERLAEEGKLVWKRMSFSEAESGGGFSAESGGVFPADCALVVAATDRREINVRVSELCRKQGIPVNVVDVKELCTFYFPAVVKRGDVVVGISTGGKSPALAARIRRELEEAVPERYGKAADILGACREEISARVPDGQDRKELFELLLSYLLDGETQGKDSRKT